GEGPTLIEYVTYRTRPHAEGMSDFGYRSREEVEEWKLRCPIQRLRQLLHRNPRGLDAPDAQARNAVQAAMDAIDAEVAQLIAEAHQFAESSPWPDPATATRHVFAEPPLTLPSPPRGEGSIGLPSPPGGEGRVRGPATREITFMKATHEVL